MTEVGIYLKAADAMLVHLRKDPLFEITIPSKTQAYMAVGKPLLMAVQGDAAELVKQSGGGLVAESENPQSLAQAAEALANTSTDALAIMGHHAKVFYQQHLGLAVGVHRFSELFQQITRKS
jgi:glycosyltransferase involved in cell wall biosynthesis